jgi:hypothetical protein
MKKKIFKLSIIVIAIISITFLMGFVYNVNESMNPYPSLDVKVVDLGNNAISGAEVENRKADGTYWDGGITDEKGIFYSHGPSGYYNLYAYNPPRPNDVSSGDVINYFQSNSPSNPVTVVLDIFYKK